MMKNRWIPAGVVTQIARNAARSSPPTNVATCWAAPHHLRRHCFTFQPRGLVPRVIMTPTMGVTAVVERMIPTVPTQALMYMAALMRRTPVLVRDWARARQESRPHHHPRHYHRQRQLPLLHHLRLFRIVGPVTRESKNRKVPSTIRDPPPRGVTARIKRRRPRRARFQSGTASSSV